MNPPPLLGLCLQVGVVLFIEDLAKCIFTELSNKISGRVGAQYLQEREY
jgi:hypothetical protein